MTNEEREALIAQGWTPPKVVDPDIAEAAALYNQYHSSNQSFKETLFAALKRGRELERAEAKPGMVWVKHDGSNHCPVDPDSYVWINNVWLNQKAIFKANAVGWPNISHYAIITPPTEDK